MVVTRGPLVAKIVLKFLESQLTGGYRSLWWDFNPSPQFCLDFASGWRGDQSFGGKDTRQNVGLGRVNSTPT